jgi:hypothetical protein
VSGRFYFDLTSSHEVIRDREGVEVSDVERAIEQAHAEVDRMRASGELSDTPVGWFLVIRDERDVELKRIQI